ncbi:MAG: YdiY family protein [Kiritimatiellia bacterium]
MFSRGTVAAVFAASCVWAVAADEVVFKSGASLKGTVVAMAGGEITFKSDDVGEVKIKQEKIAKLVTEKAAKVQYVDKSVAEGVIAGQDGTYTLSGKPLDLKKVKAINPEPEKWHGSVNFNGTMARGNTVSEKVSVLADVNRRWEKDRLAGNFGYYFAQNGVDNDSKMKTEDRIELGAQEDHFWATKVYTYVNGKYERDGINDLMYRYRLGAGLGYQWLDGFADETTGKWSFNQEAGLTYIKERYEHVKDDDRMTVRYAHHLEWAPRWVDKLAFTHNLEYLPDTDDWAESYLIDADVGFTYALAAAWQLLGKFEWDYNSNPPGSTKSSDFRYMLGLGYKW